MMIWNFETSIEKLNVLKLLRLVNVTVILLSLVIPALADESSDSVGFGIPIAAPNYSPVGCTENGLPLPLDSIYIDSLSGTQHQDCEFTYIQVKLDLYANLQVHCQNGVQVPLSIHSHRENTVGTGCGFDTRMYYYTFPTLSDVETGWNDLSTSTKDAWWVGFRGLPETVQSLIQSAQEQTPEKFLPPPDTSNHRVLARPVLFVHGIDDDAGGWGVQFANRKCGQDSGTFEKLLSWNISTQTQTNPIYSLNPTALLGFTNSYYSTINLTGQMGCIEDTHQVTDTASIILDPLQRTWNINTPWLGFFQRDNPPIYQYSEVGSNNWVEFGSTTPGGLQPIEIRAIVPKPGNLNLITTSWSVGNPPSAMDQAALDLTDSTGAWWSAMLTKIPDLSKVFYLQGTTLRANMVLYDTVVLENTGDSSWQKGELVPWKIYRNREYTYLLPNTYSDVLVRGYKGSTGPDIIARIERLDQGYDSTNAQAGINRNGIYFFTALDDAGDTLSPFQPPMWDPTVYGYNAVRGQARQLFDRMDTVLNHHYGQAWQTDTSKKIDIVCHSQGCLVTRDMIRNNQTDQTAQNPVNHIRKVVSLDSPAFGSAMATVATDLSPSYSSLGLSRHLLLDTTDELVPDKDVSLGFVNSVELPFDFGVGGGLWAYNTCSDAVNIPGISEIAGWECGQAAFDAGIILGEYVDLANLVTDTKWSIKGGLLGPYDLRVRTNTFGFTTVNHFSLPNSKTARKAMDEFADTTRDLSQSGAWIDSLRNSGYPVRPINGSSIPFSVRYSGSTGHIIDSLGKQAAADIQQYCDEHDDLISANCDYLQQAVAAVLGTGKITSDPTVNSLLLLVDSLQSQWTEQGDLAVEKASQLMVNQNLGFNPGNPLLHFDTSSYRFQTAYAVGASKFVTHIPISIDESKNVFGSNLSLKLYRPGANLLGLDILAALGYDTLAFTQGIQALPRDGGSVLIPPLASVDSAVVGAARALVGTSAIMQQLPVQGDFNVEIISGDSLLQGIAVRTDSTGPLNVLAVWDRTQGVFLTSLHPDGSRSTRILTNGGRPVRIRLTRSGSLFTMTATGFDDLVNSDTVQLTLPAQLWLGALSTSEVASSDSLRPILAGNVEVTDTTALLADQPWNLVVLERDASTSTSFGQPRIVLVNRDSRSLPGFKLYYEFRADPSHMPVLQSFQGPGTASLESLGGDRWRVEISAPGVSVAPGVLFPTSSGYTFQLNYQDGTQWPRTGEWSSYDGSPVLRSTDRVQVRDVTGNVLFGIEMPSSDSGRRAAAVGLARDEALSSNNEVAPVVVIRNTGGVPLLDYHAYWYVRAPIGATVSLGSWYTPDAQAKLKSLGNGLWMVDLYFGGHVLYPGQSTGEQKIGIYLSDWSPWDRSVNPTAATVSQGTSPVAGMAVVDSAGHLLWGNLPNLADTTSAQGVTPPSTGSALPVSVVIRDENPTDNTWIRPRIILTNNGSTTLTGFVITYPILVDTGKVVQVAPWYAPGCKVGVVPGSPSLDTVQYICQNLSMAPGAVWPDLGGAVVGIQYEDGTLWDRAIDPFVSSWTQNFESTTEVGVKALQ